MRCRFRLVALTLVWGIWLYSPPGLSARLTVDRADPACDDTAGRPYCSPLAALAAAQAADTIFLYNGPYRAAWRLDKDLVLVGGPNGKTVLEGADAGPVVTIAPGISVELHGLVVRGGRAEEGAGILNRGTLLLDDCVVKDNVAEFRGGGIFSGDSLSGRLRVINSVIADNKALGDDPYNVKYGGGGIYNRGPMFVQASRILDNYAHDNGGGIYTVFAGRAQPTDAELMAERFGIQADRGRKTTLHRVVDEDAVRIEGTTIAGNEGGAGGGIHVQGSLVLARSLIRENRATNSSLASGGGVFAHFDTYLSVINSVISANEAAFKGGGVRFFSSGWGKLYNVSIVNNRVAEGGRGAGLFVVPTTKRLTISHTMLAKNSSGSRASDCDGTIESEGFNLVGNARDCQWRSAQGDLIGTGVTPLDPLLSGDAGGLYRLSPHSPAVDAGDPAVCGAALQSDYHDKPRPVDGNGDGVKGCDIGAIERQG